MKEPEPGRPLDLLVAAGRRGVRPGRPLLLTPRGGGAFRSLDLAALDEAVDRRAEALAGETTSGRVHALTVAPEADSVVELLALWRLGVTPAPLNPALTGRELRHARRALEGWAGRGAQVVLWTSGTSGSPRGVALGAAGLAAHVDAVSARLGVEPASDLWAATLSPAHVGGFMLLFRALLTGSPAALPGPLDAPGLARLLDGGVVADGLRRPVTHLSLVPTQLRRLLEARGAAPAPAGLRCVLLGGAHAPRPLLERALAGGWPVALTWGMTEMSSQVATATPDEVRRKPGSVGRPLEGVEVRVGVGGELLVRGPGRALGYLGGTALPDEGGWYPTGDLGHVDEAGALFVTGRRSDRIVTGGVTVDAREVEEAVRAHPSVSDACVVGVPDEEWGEVVAALVVPVEGEFDAEEVGAWLRGRLSGPKRPRRWGLAAGLPLNANGKVDRARVRERLGRAPGSSAT